MSAAFAAAADAWGALLADEELSRFLDSRFDAVAAVAVALAQPNAENAIDWDAVREQYKSEQDEQRMLSLVFAIQEVIEVAVRENMAFLVDEAPRASASGDSADQLSAMQRDAAAQQDALVQRLPEGFRLAFIKTLRTHWTALRASATGSGLKLNRLEHMSWHVAPPYVLMRIVTSDHKQRIVKVPMKQFHQLRYSAAKVLQEMNEVEAHPIMRLTNLEKSRSHTRGTGESAP